MYLHCASSSDVMSLDRTAEGVEDITQVGVELGETDDKLCPTGTVSSDGETKCTMDVTCPANTMKTTGTGSCEIEAWVKCANCNFGDEAPAGCGTVCAADDCTNTCKYSDGASAQCTDCPAFATGSGAKDTRSRTGANPCRQACNECKKDDTCVWVAGRNHNDSANPLANPTADDEDCQAKSGSR